MVGIGFAADFGDREQLTRQVDRLGQFIDQHSWRSAADVHGGEDIAQIVRHAHFCPQLAEIGMSLIRLKLKAVKRAVWAQAFTKGHVHVERVSAIRARTGQMVHHDRFQLQVATGHNL